jgi:glycosyltransferase involved in cell wall biosynthesis
MSAAHRPRPRVAVFSPNLGAPSETFIRAHIERLPLETVPIYGNGWRRADAHGPLWPVLRFPGAALKRIFPPAGRALYARSLARMLRRTEADVALAEYGITGAEVLDACRLAGIPLVAYFYGYEAWRTSLVEQHLPAYRRLFAGAAAVVAVSDSIRRRLLDWGAPAEKVHHIVCGADPERFAGAVPESAACHFVAVGRFTAKKAPQSTLRAFGAAAADEPAARLSMVGDGPLLEATRRLAAELGLQERVSFLGVRPAEEVARLFRTARAFVQHSVTAADGDREGTPVAILEAQMAGLPVVSTRHSGIPEIVVDGETGLLVDEGDDAAMGKAMSKLARDPALAGRLGRNARTRALKLYSLDGSLADLARVLQQAAFGVVH